MSKNSMFRVIYVWNHIIFKLILNEHQAIGNVGCQLSSVITYERTLINPLFYSITVTDVNLLFRLTQNDRLKKDSCNLNKLEIPKIYE